MVLRAAAWLAQIIDIPNSMTVLPELLPYSVEMVRQQPPALSLALFPLPEVQHKQPSGLPRLRVAAPAREPPAVWD